MVFIEGGNDRGDVQGEMTGEMSRVNDQGGGGKCPGGNVQGK